MQKTLQKKFVITAMAAISVLLLILLGAINGLNFWQTDRQTDRLLETLTRQAAAAPRSEPGMLPFPDMSGKREPGDFFSPPVTEDHAMSARYFCVWFDREGSVARTDIGRISSVSLSLIHI